MKYAPEKVFILENGKYKEITYNVAEVKDTVTDENGNNLMDGEYHPLPARMLFTPAPLAASAPKNVQR